MNYKTVILNKLVHELKHQMIIQQKIETLENMKTLTDSNSALNKNYNH